MRTPDLKLCVPTEHPRLRVAGPLRAADFRLAMARRGTDFVSVALFFNLANPATARNAAGYQNTTATDIRAWLHEGEALTTSQFMRNYWSALSYGNFQFGMDALRDASGNFLIPSITPANDDAADWGDIAAQILRANPQRAWEISGGRVVDGKRLIPSVVVVQRYSTGASAWFAWNYEFSSGGQTYVAGDIFHIGYSVALNELGLPGTWATMCHEYAHNFLEGVDLYGGGGGKIGYWDLLGDNSPPGHMSETSSFYKQRLGWINFKQVLNGPMLPAGEYRLRHYTATGEAIKVVPDPALNPQEYFLLEFRGPSGDPRWTPDGALQESGLLITHVNTRLGDGGPRAASMSPFMDVEEADTNDGKCWDDRAYCDLPWSDASGAAAGSPGTSTYPPNNWPAWNRMPGVLYPFGGNNSFTPTSAPNSSFYGGRASGLSITNIRRVGDEMVFSVAIAAEQARYTLSGQDRFYSADFNGDGKDEALIFNGSTLALAEAHQNQFHVYWQAAGNLGAWRFGPRDRLSVGDFNGDGRADVFIRSSRWAGLFLSSGQGLDQVWIVEDWIGGWRLGADNSEFVGDFDGDGRDDIFIRSPQWAGLLLSTGESFENVWMTGDPAQNRNWIGGWNLGSTDRHYPGDFDGDGKTDIFIRSDRWAALLISNGRGFDNVWMTGDPAQNLDWIGGWHLGPGDRHYVGDFNGDGRSDVLIRSDRWAALLVSNGRGLDNVWMTGDPASNLDWIDGWHLGSGDRHVVGDFNGDGRADIFIRSDQWGAVLLSDGVSLRVEWMSGDPANGWNYIGPWRLAAGDRELAARFNYDPNDDVFLYRPGEKTGAAVIMRDGNTGKMYPELAWQGNSVVAAKDPGRRQDRFYLGRFTGGPGHDVLVFNGRRLALFGNQGGTLQRIWQSGDWIGGWHLGPYDRLLIADFTGDGRDDIFIRSPHWAGLLRSTGAGFEQVWMTGDPAQNRDWIGGWHLSPLDRVYAGDFSGDGRADVYIRSPHWAGLLRSTGAGFQQVWMTGDPAQNRDWIGGWHIGPQDREYIGDFNGDGKAEIFIRSPLWAGLIVASGASLNTVWMTGDPAQNRNWIGGWHLGPQDRHYVGDFTGDGRADIFIRSPRWAGLLRSTGSSFEEVWMTGDPALNRDWIGGWYLGSRDRHWVGDFSGEGRADILIRSNDWIGLLTSRGTSFTSSLVQEASVDAWDLNRADDALVGRFTGLRRDEILIHHPHGWTGILTPSAAGTPGQLQLRLSNAWFRAITAGDLAAAATP